MWLPLICSAKPADPEAVSQKLPTARMSRIPQLATYVGPKARRISGRPTRRRAAKEAAEIIATEVEAVRASASISSVRPSVYITENSCGMMKFATPGIAPMICSTRLAMP